MSDLNVVYPSPSFRLSPQAEKLWNDAINSLGGEESKKALILHEQAFIDIAVALGYTITLGANDVRLDADDESWATYTDRPSLISDFALIENGTRVALQFKLLSLSTSENWETGHGRTLAVEAAQHLFHEEFETELPRPLVYIKPAPWQGELNWLVLMTEDERRKMLRGFTSMSFDNPRVIKGVVLPPLDQV